MLSVELRHPLRAFTLELRLEVAAGECLALAGPSGAGKTSALRAIAGLLRAEHARVRCAGEIWDGAGVHVAPERRRCGFLFQDYALFGHMTRMGERRIRAARPPRGSPRGGHGAAGALRHRVARGRAPARPVRRRAPARRARPGAGAPPRRAAARRAAVGARRRDPRRGDRGAAYADGAGGRPRAPRHARLRRGGRARRPRRRDRARPRVAGGLGRDPRSRAAVGLRRRLHGRDDAARRRHAAR